MKKQKGVKQRAVKASASGGDKLRELLTANEELSELDVVDLIFNLTSSERVKLEKLLSGVDERVKSDFQEAFQSEMAVISSCVDDEALEQEEAAECLKVLTRLSSAKLTLFYTGMYWDKYFSELSERQRDCLTFLIAGRLLTTQAHLLKLSTKLVKAKYVPIVIHFYTHFLSLPQEKIAASLKDKSKYLREWHRFLRKSGITKPAEPRGRKLKREYDLAYDYWVQTKRNGTRKYTLPEIIRKVNQVKYGKVNFLSYDGKNLIKRFRGGIKRREGKPLKRVVKRAIRK